MADAIVVQFAFVSREEAKARGLSKYFTGEPCQNGHVDQRYVSNKRCCGCKVDSDARHRDRYPGKNEAQCKAYYEKNKTRHLEVQKAYREANKAELAAYDKARNDANREALREYHKSYYASNKEGFIARAKQWKQVNPFKVKVNGANRRAKKRAAGGKYTARQIEVLHKAQKGKCVNCRNSIKDAFHIDHVTPIALGGSNGIENIQLLCPDCNLRKGAQDPLKWAQKNGRLL